MKRKESERTKFERWWNEIMGMPRDEIRSRRAENGYNIASLDFAWMGWQGRAQGKREEHGD